MAASIEAARITRRRAAAALGVALALALAAGNPASAQTAAPQDPALAQLDRLAGTWEAPGTFVDSAYSKAGTAHATTTCAWSDDRVFMICQQRVTTQAGTDGDVALYTYDPAGKAYRFYHVSRTAATGSTIAVTPGEIVYSGSFTDGAKQVTTRTLNVWQSPQHYTWRAEYSLDGGKTWVLMGSGSATRVH